jgi:hypothetical protein
MSSFADKSFQERLLTMGTIAQTAFETWAKTKDIRFVKYGFDRPDFKQFWQLPLFIRATPDYVCETGHNFFVEVKGARGKHLKIKDETMRALDTWNSYITVWFFLYRDDTDAYDFVNYRTMHDLCLLSPTKRFIQDKKLYYEIATKQFDWKGTKDE